MSTTTTIRVSFMRERVHLGLMARNDLFREAVLKFEPRPHVWLVREGYNPVRLEDANDADTMFAEGAVITGTLKPTTTIIPGNA